MITSLFSFPETLDARWKIAVHAATSTTKRKKIVLVRELNFVISILDYTWSMRWRNHPTISALSTRLTRWCIPVGERFSQVTWLLFWCVLCWVCWVQHNTQPTGSSSSRWFMEIQTLELWVRASVCDLIIWKVHKNKWKNIYIVNSKERVETMKKYFIRWPRHSLLPNYMLCCVVYQSQNAH